MVLHSLQGLENFALFSDKVSLKKKKKTIKLVVFKIYNFNKIFNKEVAIASTKKWFLLDSINRRKKEEHSTM